MRFVVKLILLFLLTLPEVACVYRSTLSEGIACFRTENYRQAFILLKPMADRGHPEAQYAVGYMYYYGQGVIEDRKKAWVWIKRAAAAGQTDAILALKILKSKPIIKKRDPLDPLIYQSTNGAD